MQVRWQGLGTGLGTRLAILPEDSAGLLVGGCRRSDRDREDCMLLLLLRLSLSLDRIHHEHKDHIV